MALVAAAEACPHYERHCNLVCPACSEPAPCRLCHAETASHELDRFAVTTLECRQCGLRQSKAKECAQCGVCFGKYSCLECSLFDDVDRGQFHCSGCRLCRVGGRDNFRHCDQCGYCMTLQHYDGHQCLAGASSRPCPVCLEDIHSSRLPPKVLKCRHLLHDVCFTNMVQKGIFACPVCGKTMFDMTKEWKKIDQLVRETPMPACYRGVCCQVSCKDCNQECITPFHIEALKCRLCGSYNTARSGGSLVRKKTMTGTAACSNNQVNPPSASEGSTDEAVASQSSGETTAATSEAAANSSDVRQPTRSANSVISAALEFLTATTRSRSPSPSPSGVPQAPLVVAAPQDVPSPFTAAVQAMDTSPPSARAASLLSALDESWLSVASLNASTADDSTSEPVPAREELDLYETVDVTELEESEQPADGGAMALLDGLLQQLQAESFADALEDHSDDFSSMTSSNDESEPPQVLSVEIDGRVARLEEAEASDWETDEGEEERQSGAEEQFDTAESD